MKVHSTKRPNIIKITIILRRQARGRQGVYVRTLSYRASGTALAPRRARDTYRRRTSIIGAVQTADMYKPTCPRGPEGAGMCDESRDACETDRGVGRILRIAGTSRWQHI